MKRGIIGALASAGGFVAGYFIPTLAFILVYFLGRTPSASGRAAVVDDTLMVLYLAAAYALAGATVYAAITLVSRNWRQRPPGKVAAISALVGVVAQILNWTGLSIVAMVPLMHVLPRNVDDRARYRDAGCRRRSRDINLVGDKADAGGGCCCPIAERGT